MTSDRPDVSIIVVVHNDAENLAESIGSATSQTLANIEVIVVDDCSDDGSFEVANQLAEKDPRIRTFRTESNSGGPGAPRNLGIAQSRAPWLTFLDSDDVLDPRAAELLFAAAEPDDTDIVCGHTERLYLEDGHRLGWRPPLYQIRRHISSIDEFVDLVIDTTATGKLYRRALFDESRLAFLERVQFEDQIFSAQAYSRAAGITIIPERVYVWKVYPSQERKSITNRRDSEENLMRRLDALQLAQDAVAGHQKLLARYQLKFLQHDARLYLKDFGDVDRDFAQRTLVILEPWLRRIPATVYANLTTCHRLLYGAALLHSVDGVRELLPVMNGRATLEGMTEKRAEHTVWRPTVPFDTTPPPDSLELALLDLTGDPILHTPFSAIRYRHVVEAIKSASERGVVVRGSTADPFERIGPDIARARAEAVVQLRDTDATFGCRATLAILAEQRIGFEIELEIPRGLALSRSKRLDISLAIEVEGSANIASLYAPTVTTAEKFAPQAGSLRALLRESFAPYRTITGKLALKQENPVLFRKIESALIRLREALG